MGVLDWSKNRWQREWGKGNLPTLFWHVIQCASNNTFKCHFHQCSNCRQKWHYNRMTQKLNLVMFVVQTMNNPFSGNFKNVIHKFVTILGHTVST